MSEMRVFFVEEGIGQPVSFFTKEIFSYLFFFVLLKRSAPPGEVEGARTLAGWRSTR
jgi:hypothetical protein